MLAGGCESQSGYSCTGHESDLRSAVNFPPPHNLPGNVEFPGGSLFRTLRPQGGCQRSSCPGHVSAITSGRVSKLPASYSSTCTCQAGSGAQASNGGSFFPPAMRRLLARPWSATREPSAPVRGTDFTRRGVSGRIARCPREPAAPENPSRLENPPHSLTFTQTATSLLPIPAVPIT